MKPNQQRAKTAIISLYAIGILGVLLGFSQLNTYFALKGIINGSADIATLQKAGIIQLIALAFWFLAYILTIITFIMWFRRGYYNLHQVPGIRPLFAEGWASGAWFVPFLNLGRPYVIMKEMMGDSQHILQREGLIEKGKDRVVLVGWWWAMLITDNVLSNISSRIGGTGISSAATQSLGGFLVGLFQLIPMFLAIRMIKRYSELETLLPEIGTAQSFANPELLDA